MTEPDYEELKNLIQQIEDGLPFEKEEALDLLHEKVTAGEDPTSWNLLGIGYLQAGYVDSAIDIFQQLVDFVPEEDVYRINLAMAYLQNDQPSLAQYHYQHLAEKGRSEDGRLAGQQGLEYLHEAARGGDEDVRFQQLQIAALFERVSNKTANAEDYQRLGNLLLKRESQGDSTYSLVEITAMLEDGEQRYPEDLGILELLTLCYARRPVGNRLEQTLQKIEKIDPDSRILEVFNEISEEDDAEFYRNMNSRAWDLLNQTQSDDPELRAAALEELRRMVTTFPTNPNYRSVYAFALGLTGNKEEALTQAEIAAENAIEDHSLHFNLGQVFWMGGDDVRGRHHLELSIKFAATEEERQDALERIAYLEGN